jgi:phage-related protein
MSGVVTEIIGKETVSKAAEDAKNALSKMGEDSKGIFDKITLTAGDVVNAVKGIANTVSEFVNAYATQEKAVNSLNSAIELSGKAGEYSSKGLQELASQLQAMTGIGDETTIQLEAMLVATGRSDEEIRKMITAAANYSAATGKDFKTIVEDLDKSFSGSARTLAQFNPEIKALSKEELEAGAAVDVLLKKYDGFAAKMSGSTSTSLAVFNAAMGDVKESIGQAIVPAILPILQEAVPFLQNVVIPAFQSLAPTVSEIATTIKDLIVAFVDAIKPWLDAFAQYWKDTLGPNIKAIIDIIKNVLGLLSAIFKGDWATVWNDAKKIVQDVIDIIGNSLKGPADLAKRLWDGIKAAWASAWDGLKLAVKGPIDAIIGFFKPVLDAVNTVIGGIEKAVQWVSGEHRTGKWLLDKNNKIIGEYIAGADGTETLKRYASGTPGAKPGWALVGEEGPELVYFNGGETVVPNHKIGGYAEGTLRGGGAVDALDIGGGDDLSWLTQLMEAVKPIVDQFTALISPLSSIKEILNPLQTIFSAMMDVLGPLINTILAPIVGILRIVGTTLGAMIAPILSALGPIIKIIGDAFVWLYNNVIRPFANAIIWVGNAIYNGIAKAINFLLGWLGVHMEEKSMTAGQLAEITQTDLVTASAAGAGGTTGASARYEKPRDITVNVTVETSALVGTDGISEFALIIGRELKAAGVLGLS